MKNFKEKSPREIIDDYSPIMRGRKGLSGFVRRMVAKPLEIARDMLDAVSRFPVRFGHENTAGQIITDCRAAIPATFHRMEEKLKTAFNKATGRGASPIDRENFLHLAEQVRADSDVLGRECTILRTEFDTVTERYNFILVKEPLGDRDYKMKTLEQGVAEVRQHMQGASAVAADICDDAPKTVAVRRKPIQLDREQTGI